MRKDTTEGMTVLLVGIAPNVRVLVIELLRERGFSVSESERADGVELHVSRHEEVRLEQVWPALYALALRAGR